MADGGSASGLGSGGMTSKLQAAEIAERAGIALAIVNGTHDGARSPARSSAEHRHAVPADAAANRARKAWLGGRLRLQGRAGGRCRRGARRWPSGSSLLAKGITGGRGRVPRAATRSRSATPTGSTLAHGLAEYDAGECVRLIGAAHSSEHAALLGYAPRSAVIHRDQLVLL